MDTGAYDTNTLLLNNVTSITFRIYEPRAETTQSQQLAALEAESTLRGKGHIVYHDTNRGSLWLFQLNAKSASAEAVSAPTPASTTDELATSLFSLSEQGTIDPATLHRGRSQNIVPDSASPTTLATSSSDLASRLALPPKPQSPDHDQQISKHSRTDSRGPTFFQNVAYENFLAGLLGTTSSKLAHATSSILINYRTVLLRPRNGNNSEATTLCTLSAYLTTAGSLVLRVAAKLCEGLAPHQSFDAPPRSPLGHQVLTAPFGLLAIDQAQAAHLGGTLSMANTPATQALSIRGHADRYGAEWKQACSKALQLRGVDPSVLDDCSWMNVSIPRRAKDWSSTAPLSWPAPLCFRRKALSVGTASRIEQDVIRGHEESHDPLGQARGWFNAAHEREEKQATRKAERLASENVASRATRAGPDVATAANLARAGASLAGHMYPTPPDGIQQNSGVTPSFDATASPGNPPSATAGLDVDAEITNITTDAKNGETFGQDHSDSEEPTKAERGGSNMLDNADNMFGDMEADIFGENEMNDITEDDFNFFDEVGDEPPSMVPEVEMAEVPEAEVPVKQEVIAEDPPTPDAVPSSPAQQEIEAPPSPVFAKPELKHARSSLGDESLGRNRSSRGASVKRESSPFNPDTVFKRVRASLLATTLSKPEATTQGRERRSSVFGKVSFDPALPLINKKYEQGGAYDFGAMVANDRSDHALTDAENLKKRVKASKRPKESAGTLLRRFTAVEASTAHPSPTKLDDSLSDDDDSSDDPDSDDSSFTTEGPNSPTKASVKRARLDEEIASQVASVKDLDLDDEPEPLLAVEVPRLSRTEKPELRISRFFADPEPLATDVAIPDEDLINMAQILTEQAATGSLQVHDLDATDRQGSIVRARQRQVTMAARNAMHAIQNAGIQGLEQLYSGKFKDVLETQDALVTGQPNRMQPRPIPGREPFNDMKVSNFYALPLPHLEMKRASSKLSILPTAAMFWESLGLAPVSGEKNILAACVFPSWKGVSDNVSTFLGRLKSMYELLRLGMFSNVMLSGEEADGLLPYEVDRISTSPEATMAANGSAMTDAMEPLRTAIKNNMTSDINIVLYFAYSPNNPSSIVEACTAFQSFFDFYKKTLSSKRDLPKNELVLQLVPLDLVSSPTSLVLTPSNELMRMSIETYDRCTSFTQPMPAPAITLEQPVPRHINFECSPKASASITHEHSSMHIAYAQSIDERWVTAAWTDDRGRQQATASFCLGRKGRPLSTSMNEVAHEIWESTVDLISTWKVQWRIVIAKCGPMDEDELKFWIDLARTQDKGEARVSLTLLSVESDPALQVFPAAAKIPQTATTLGPTPVSTPQASVVSPDQVATPATPARDSMAPSSNTPGGDTATDPEPDSSLLNSTDQTWVALVGHRLSISPNATELQPALLSGYLLKRTGPSADETPTVLEVNLVHVDISPRQYETSLREILSWYSALGTLARARGVVPRDADVRPWHIAAAEKAVRALYLLL
ncbi:hypothetical protein CC79DRAFT_817163 [Sarocladium strictum]